MRDPLLLGKGTPKGDIYSFAIILQEIIVRGHPFCMLDLDADGTYSHHYLLPITFTYFILTFFILYIYICHISIYNNYLTEF